VHTWPWHVLKQVSHFGVGLIYLPVPQMRHRWLQGSNMAWIAVLMLVFVGHPWLALMLAFFILILE
jgi:hypothetical protein